MKVVSGVINFFTISVQSFKGHTWAKKVNKWKIKTHRTKNSLNGQYNTCANFQWKRFRQTGDCTLTNSHCPYKPLHQLIANQVRFHSTESSLVTILCCLFVTWKRWFKAYFLFNNLLYVLTLFQNVGSQMTVSDPPPRNEWKVVNCSRNTSLCLKRIQKKTNDPPPPQQQLNLEINNQRLEI